jgi:hypothetical protein
MIQTSSTVDAGGQNLTAGAKKLIVSALWLVAVAQW